MFSVKCSHSVISDFATQWTAAGQASLSITNSWSLLKFMSFVLVMPFNHLILCHPLLLLPAIFPSIRVFSNESVFCIRWPKYWSLRDVFKGKQTTARVHSCGLGRLQGLQQKHPPVLPQKDNR